MPQTFSSLADIHAHGFDTVIDVRSPAEFAIDHFPGAINLPSLSNEERAEVGTTYKQVSPFLARKMGASLVLHNVARHIAGPLNGHDGGWRPLVYCWRGGQRSGVFTTILKEVGWRADTIKGGYQSYRRLVSAALYDKPIPHKLVLLDGYTGTAKTALLPLLQDRDVQVIDLEGLARHRGSLLGAMPGGQPSQRMFETNLAQALSTLDPARPVVVEAESNRIGAINVPPSFWARMIQSPRINISANIAARAAYLAEAYDDILRDPETVSVRLASLRYLRSHAVVDHWKSLQDDGKYLELAQSLMTDHYDPAYAKSRNLHARDVQATIEAERLDPSGLQQVADQITRVLQEN